MILKLNARAIADGSRYLGSIARNLGSILEVSRSVSFEVDLLSTMTGRGRTLKHLCFHGCQPDAPGSGRPPKPCKGHEQNFCGHQQNYECWQRGHRCGVGDCKCQCVDCQKDAAPESEPDVYASCAGNKRAGSKRPSPRPAGMLSLTAGYHSLTQSLTRSLPHSLQDQARKRLLPPRAAIAKKDGRVGRCCFFFVSARFLVPSRFLGWIDFLAVSCPPFGLQHRQIN
jgi:hypothetical protein